MKRPLLFICAAVILAIPCYSQTNTPSPAPSSAATNAMKLPSDEGIVARLLANFDGAKAKVGDIIQAETTRDIKQGHETILKRGSIISGHITQITPFTEDNKKSTIVIEFDSATPKGGSKAFINVELVALATEVQEQVVDLKDGRGMVQNHEDAGISGHLGATPTTELGPTAMGVYGYAGVTLATLPSASGSLSYIYSEAGDLKMKKNTQMVFKP
jgi:hypothetical protein